MTPISSQESPVQDQGSPQSYLMMETPVWDTHGQCTTNYDNVKCNGVDCFDRLDAQESSSWGKQAKATMTTMPNMMMGMTMGMTMDVGMTMGDASIDSLCDFDDDTLSSSSLVTTNSQAQPAMHKAPRAERASQAPRTTGSGRMSICVKCIRWTHMLDRSNQCAYKQECHHARDRTSHYHSSCSNGR